MIQGTVDKDDADFLLTGEAGRGYTDIVIKDKELHSLAKLWVRGVKIDWNLFCNEGQPSRISLPTYPFAKGKALGLGMKVPMNLMYSSAII